MSTYGTILEPLKSLQENAFVGDTKIVVIDPTGILPGNMLHISSSAVWRQSANLQKQGELRYVASVDGQTINLTEPLEDSYQAASCVGTIYNVIPNSGFTIDGLRFVNTAMSKWLYGLRLYYATNFKVINCFASQFEIWFMEVAHCREGWFNNNEIMNSWQAGMGYGIVFDYTNQNHLINYNYLHNCRHNTAIGGGYGTPGGIARHLKFEHNTSLDSTVWDGSAWQGGSQQLDCHHSGEDIQFNYNDCSGKGDGIGGVGPYTGLVFHNNLHDLEGYGVRYRNELSKKIIVQENTINNTLYGIIIGAWDSLGDYSHVNMEVLVNTITNSRYNGITMVKALHNEVHHNTLRTAPNWGIQLQTTCQYNVIHDNDLLGAGNYRNFGDYGTYNIHYRNLGVDPSDFNTYVVNYLSKPLSVDYIINDTVVPSGTPTLVNPGFTTILKFQKRVVI
jgi:hypothetical protein